jgi:hypothetical protein
VSLDFPASTHDRPCASEQSQFLLHLIKNAVSTASLSSAEQTLIVSLEKDCSNILTSIHSDTDKLANIRDKIRNFIPDLERQNHAKLIAHFKQNGLYRMFYHKARIKGERNTTDLSLFLKLGFIGVLLSALAVTFFVASSLLAMPAWLMIVANGLFASAMVYISALSYGIVNDIYATDANLPYFLFGHQGKQHSLIETNDPLAQGIAWGVAATFEPAAIAAAIFGIVTTVTGYFFPIANIVFPIAMGAMPLIARKVDQYAKQNQQERLEQLIDFPEGSFTTGSNPYQRNASDVLQTKKVEYVAYRANSDRNLFGFTKIPLMGIGLLGTMFTMSAAHSFLPTFLFSAAATTLLPIVAGGIGIIMISSAGIYTYVNRHKQIDNRFKLAFHQELDTDLDELYLDEDLERIAEFIQSQQPIIMPTPILPPINMLKASTCYFNLKATQQPCIKADNLQVDSVNWLSDITPQRSWSNNI